MESVKVSFNSDTGEVTIDDVTRSLRPKTFQLAQFLAERSGQVISKDVLLSAVWTGSIVEDQAVFQSINEIRKAFAGRDVIKTFPRRGYSWLIPSTDVGADAVVNAEAVTAERVKRIDVQTTTKSGAITTRRVLAGVAIGLVLLSLFTVYLIKQPTSSAIATTHADSVVRHPVVVILPVSITGMDNSQHWLRFGAMDALIQQFSDSPDITVFQPDDVFDILKRTKNAEQHPESLFNLSAATLIVESALNGVPGDYVMTYRLISPVSEVKGVLHDVTVDTLLHQLAELLSEQLQVNQTLRPVNFEEQFRNTLIYNAMQLIAAADYVSAQSFLESAIITFPDAPEPRYWLARALYLQQASEDSLQVINEALNTLKSEESNRYYARLYYLKGSALLNLHQDDALLTLQHALTLAEKNNDWLYVAYTQSLIGHYYLQTQTPEQASGYFTEAMKYQQVLNCPMGIVQSHLDWADYYLALQNKPEAMRALSDAKALASQRSLTQTLPLINAKSQKIQQL
ncbi:transcriptional regulator [Aestuariibacter sp. GS-14]|uniref:transcriptional regulator n=1 Tax=Aestuariibacter sp. GS-14 TaxID=2590670 RepID=UPI0015E85A62|nr:winged helix-turn-helix domain-containing protein [Aestuariibacter sp. GS-14]